MKEVKEYFQCEFCGKMTENTHFWESLIDESKNVCDDCHNAEKVSIDLNTVLSEHCYNWCL
jgi:ribosome-binding protein aMBF1 (putative translation factor)